MADKERKKETRKTCCSSATYRDNSVQKANRMEYPTHLDGNNS
jgi:hypothetical protein